MVSALFLAVSLCVATATISNCHKSQEEGKVILVLYSSSTDFDKNVAAYLNASVELMARNLKLIFYDLGSSGCDDQTFATLSVLIKNQIFHEGRSKVAGIVGPSCTDAAYTVAKLIKRSRAHVGHIHTSPMPALLAAKVHNASWGLHAPADILANASVELVKHANWSQVFAFYQHILTDINHIFMLFKRQLKDWVRHNKNNSNNRSISSNKNTIFYTSILQNVPINLHRILSDHSGRILFLMLDAEQARNILCQAFVLKAYYPFYQWVIVKMSQNDLISVEKVYMEAYVCDKLDILRVLKNALFVNFQTKVTGNVFFSNRVGNQHGSPWSTSFLYDCSIRAMNSILNNTELLVKPTAHPANTRTTLFDYASLTTFPREVSIEQIQNNVPVQSFLYSARTNSFKNVSENIFLISGELTEHIRVVNLPLVIVFFCINFIILVMSVILQAITFVFRLEPSVKSSSTVLLHFCYVGIYMLNLVSNIHFIKSTFVITSDRFYVALCSISIITGSFGLTLVLGTLTMKTWRLYKIFVHYMNPGKFLSNKTLLLFVCCLTLVDLVICITWFVFDPITISYEVVSRNNLEGVITYTAECGSKAYLPMFMLIVVYHALIMAVTLFIVCNTWNKIPKTQKNFLSANSVMKLVYVTIFVFSFGMTGNWMARILNFYLFEFLTLALLFQSLQASFIVLLLLPPVLPVLKNFLNKVIK